MPARVTAVILAGGVGTRLGADRPKQLLELAGRSLVGWCVAAFEAAESVDEVIVMAHPDFIDEIAAVSAGLRVLPGGIERHDTVRLALEAVDGDGHVLLHDAARPLVTPELIDDTAAALHGCRAAGTFIASTDTIVKVTSDGSRLVEVLDRPLLRRAQTPQAFHLPVIRAAHHLAAADPTFSPTDDCGVVARYLPDEPIAVVAGEQRNLKVTEPGDLEIAERLVAQ